MDNDKILERLDSNWFFCNILATPQFSHCYLKEPHKPKQPNSNIPIHQTQPIESPNIQIQTNTISKEKEPMLEAEPSEMEQRRSRRRGSKISGGKSGSKRGGKSAWMQEYEEIKGFMELGFVLEEAGLDGRLVSVVPGFQMEQTRYGFERLGSRDLHCKMPPFSDGMAMKEHLRSWAHAVACTVR